MSFSSRTKEDIVRFRVKRRGQQLSLLSGLVLSCGSLYVGRGGTGSVFATESQPVAKLILQLAEALYALDTSMELMEQQRRRNPLYVVTLTGADAQRMLAETGMLSAGDGGITLLDGVPEELIAPDEEARLFLRGVFLGSGSCLNPARGYHLELVLRAEGIAEDVISAIKRFGVTAKRHARKEKQVVYLKGDDVSGFLTIIGASNAVLAFENVRAEKEFRNYVNRANNCETANIGKTVDAGLNQVQAIERIESTVGLAGLPMPLYEAAMLRLSHPDATLQELADMADIGKSGMNHRLSRLIRMAGEIASD